MYGKIQETGLTEIIPLISTSVIWGQYPMFSHPKFPQGSLGSGCSLMVARQQVFFSFLSFLRAHQLTVLWLRSLMTVTSLVYRYGRQYSIYQQTLFTKVRKGINQFREVLFAKLQHSLQVATSMEIFVTKARTKWESNKIPSE